MRVVAGTYGGRRLKGPAHHGLRPTSGMVRRALFDTIGDRLPGAIVLDLYAGTGALGIEAKSRGSGRVTFVERDPRALVLLRQNLALLGLSPAEVEILGMPVDKALARLASAGCLYDLILADPPYGDPSISEALAGIIAGRLLSPGGLLALEHRTAAPPALPSGLALKGRRKYGDTAISFLAVEEINVE